MFGMEIKSGLDLIKTTINLKKKVFKIKFLGVRSR